jgi:adenine-specific DNA-methyltransferase
VYVRSGANWSPNRLPLNDKQQAFYKNPDKDPRGDWNSATYTCNKSKAERPNLYYPIKNPNSGEEIYPSDTAVWAYSKETSEQHIKQNLLYWGKDGKSKSPRRKIFLSEAKGVVPRSIWLYDDVGHTQEATKNLNEIIPNSGFQTPKPVRMIMHQCKIATNPNDSDIVLDFFSGSSTTAHSVMQLNADDGGNRRFIMVQLPETCEENSEASNSGYRTIAEIGKERIRRAGEKIKEELEDKQAEWKKQQALDSKKGSKLELDDETAEETNPYVLDPDSLDIGFKSFRIEDTKINWLKKDLRGEQLEFSDTTSQDALDFVPGYTDTDVVYELMLRQSNIPLTGTITKPIATAKRTYIYADAYLICLEEKITQKLVESLAAIEPTPNKYFFRDSAFGKDIALKDETFRRLKAEIHKHHGDLGAAYTVEFI